MNVPPLFSPFGVLDDLFEPPFHSFHDPSKNVAIPDPEFLSLLCSSRAVKHQAYGGGIHRLVDDFHQAADSLRISRASRDVENLLGNLRDPGQLRSEEHTSELQ